MSGKNDGWNLALIRTGADSRITVSRPDIIMYRTIGEISTYFLDGQNLRNEGRKNVSAINALDELEISVVGWVRLASERRLSRMEELAEIEDGEGQYGSNAERLKEFMTKYKTQQKFKKWTYDRMKMLRFKIYKVVHELDGQDQRPMLPSSKFRCHASQV